MKPFALLVLLWATLVVAQTESVSDDEAFADATHKEINKVPPVGQLGLEIDQNLLSIQGALDKGATAGDILQDPKLRKNLMKAFENNPMSQMPRDVLKPTLAGHLEKNPLGALTKRFPKMLDFMVDFMRHPRAISQMVKILDRPKSLRNCGIASLLLMLMFYLIKRKVIAEDMGFIKRNLIGLCFSLAFMTSSGLVLWLTFQEELAPTLEVFQQTFL